MSFLKAIYFCLFYMYCLQATKPKLNMIIDVTDYVMNVMDYEVAWKLS